MHICLTIPSLSKKTGGPASVVQHLGEYLASLGASVTVLTVEPGVGEAEALPREKGVKVIHVARGTNATAFRRALSQCLASDKDLVVHDFGLWLPLNHAVASACHWMGIPRVCSTSGMLAPWALRHKPWKKWLAWWLYQRRDLCRATLLAATSTTELKDIQRRVPRKPVVLVPNGVEFPTPTLGSRGNGNHASRKVVFLGRIHPVKGLKNLVAAWDLVRPPGWICVIAGPDEVGHKKELETFIRSRKLEHDFQFPGMMTDGQKWPLFRDANLFVLPSFTENFGISAAEALASRLPVITTRGTPWEDVVRHRCGWWVDVGIEPLAAAIREGTSLSDEERREMGWRGRCLVEKKYSWERIGKEMLSIYEWVVGRGNRPACVSIDKLK